MRKEHCKMNIRLSTIPLIISLFFVVSCGSTKQFQPSQLDRELTIDGNLSDWNTGKTLFDEREQANYYSAYDEDFLYIYIDIKSAFKDASVRRSGLTVYLSDDEEMRKSIGVGLPAGTFNLLRDYPNAFSEFTRDGEWMNQPENRELLEDLSEELFDRVMIVERSDGDNDPSYGFVDPSQLEVDGMEIAVNPDNRTIGLEMKIPRDGSSIYGFSGDQVWLGFAIEPPDFRIQGSDEYSAASNTQRDRYGNRTQQPRSNRTDMAQSLGKMERWHVIQFED